MVTRDNLPRTSGSVVKCPLILTKLPMKFSKKLTSMLQLILTLLPGSISLDASLRRSEPHGRLPLQLRLREVKIKVVSSNKLRVKNKRSNSPRSRKLRRKTMMTWTFSVKMMRKLRRLPLRLLPRLRKVPKRKRSLLKSP